MAILDILVRARNQASGPIDEATGSVHGLKNAAASAAKHGLTPLTNALSTMAANYATQAINGLVGGMRDFVAGSVSAASYVEEMRSKFAVVFGDMAGQTEEELTAMATAMNRSKFEFMDFAALIQDTFVPMGFARDEAQKLSVGLVGLATDVASFNNFADADVMRDFQSALVGNHETVRKYGVLLNETTLKEELSRMGKHDLTGAALEQAKVQARLNIIMASTADAHGDAERTSGSYANSMRGLAAVMQEFRASVGAEILPALAPFIGMIGDFVREHGPKFVEWFAEVMEYVRNWELHTIIGPIIEKVVYAIGDFINALVSLSFYLISTWTLGDSLNDWLTHLPEGMRPAVKSFGDFLVSIRDLPQKIADLIRPVRDWITENVKLGDVLGALGLVIGLMVAGPLAGLLLGAGKIALAFGGLVGLVAGVRMAWESDFLGVRTLVEGVVDHLSFSWSVLKTAFQFHGAAALREIWAFVTGNETSFENLGKIVEAFRLVFVTTLEKVVAQLGEWTVAIVDFVLRELPKWAAALGRFAEAAWTWLSEQAIPGTVNQLGQWWRALSGWVAEHVPRWAARLDELAAAAVAWLRDTAIPGTATQLAAWWDALSGFLTTTLPQWTSKLGEWGRAAWTWIRDEAFPKTREELGKLWGAFRGWLEEKLPIWRENLAKWATAAWEWLTQEAIPKTAEKLGEWWGKFADWFGKHWPEWSSRLGEWAAAAWEWLTKTAIPKTAEKLGEWWGKFTDWWGDNWPVWRKNMETWAAETWEWLRDDVIPETKTKLGEWWDEFTKWWDKNWPVWKQNMADWAAETWEWLRDDVLPNVESNLKKLWDAWNAPDGWVTKTIEWLKTTFPGATATALASFADFKDRFKEMLDELRDLMDQQSQVTFEWGVYVDAVFGILVAKFGLFANTLTGVIKTVAHLIQGEWREAWDEMKRIGDGFVTAYTEVGKHAKTIFTGQWFDTGKDVTRGFAEGIDQGTWDAVRSTGGFTDKVTREAERGFGVRSPSTVFRAIGMDVVRGFAEGVESWAAQSSVFANVRTLAQRTLEEFKRVLGIRSPSTEMYAAATMTVLGAIYGLQDMGPSLVETVAGLGWSMGDTLRLALQNVSAEMIAALGGMHTTLSYQTSAMVGTMSSSIAQMRSELAQAQSLAMSATQLQQTAQQGLRDAGFQGGQYVPQSTADVPSVRGVMGDIAEWARQLSATMSREQQGKMLGWSDELTALVAHSDKPGIPHTQWGPLAQDVLNRVGQMETTNENREAIRMLREAALMVREWAQAAEVYVNGQKTYVVNYNQGSDTSITHELLNAIQTLQLLHG